ncbi:hypothetical protein CC86DRAFT_403749 [Ophiobolus disseminans]|uniref:Uncharacterized protein n=1 Tax=Ophiobolus disseminans TaxID=1469910 RepID=A0A6A7A7D6_9PLEO|nr:hypothetical protein CC86DRAFT_403749 [Ophiobolus disseminans]
MRPSQPDPTYLASYNTAHSDHCHGIIRTNHTTLTSIFSTTTMSTPVSDPDSTHHLTSAYGEHIASILIAVLILSWFVHVVHKARQGYGTGNIYHRIFQNMFYCGAVGGLHDEESGEMKP